MFTITSPPKFATTSGHEASAMLATPDTVGGRQRFNVSALRHAEEYQWVDGSVTSNVVVLEATANLPRIVCMAPSTEIEQEAA